MKHSLANFIKPFFSHYLPVQRGLSGNTIAAYRDAMRLLICYGADHLNKSADALEVEDLTETTILAFLDHLQQHRGCKAQTRNVRLAAIRSLFNYIARTEPELLAHSRQIHAIPLKRTEKAIVDYLEEEELQALMTSVEPNTRTGVRDQALLLLLYNTGARVSEVVTLSIEDLRLSGNAQVTLKGKGRKHRCCPLWPETQNALKDYLKQRRPSNIETQALFLNAHGAPITRFGIRYVIGQYADKASEHCPSLKHKKVTPHTLRHTTAMHLLRAGNDIIMVSYWLGHADINTTHYYLEIDMQMKREMIEKAGVPTVQEKVPWHEPSILSWLNSLGKYPELCGVNPMR